MMAVVEPLRSCPGNRDSSETLSSFPLFSDIYSANLLQACLRMVEARACVYHAFLRILFRGNWFTKCLAD
jgi:hypothetical protein